MINTVPQQKRSVRSRVPRSPRVLRLIPVQRARSNPRRSNRRSNGDRIMSAPAAVGRVTGSGLSGRQRVPTMRSNGRNMTITHTERFYGVTTTATTFEIHSFKLNPGLAAMFPWLSDVANRYEKYKFRSVVFRYVSQAAAAAGTVSMAFDFDPNDDPPATMEEANTFHDYVTTSIWATRPVDLRIDLANGDRLPQKDTRPGMPGVDLDLNVYDVGTLHIMTQGAASGLVGYVEVAYTVDLFIHQVQAGVGGESVSSSGLDATHLVGNASADAQAYLPVDFTSTAAMTFVQPFEGIVSYRITGTGLSADFDPVISAGGTAAPMNGIVNAAGTTVNGCFRVRAQTGMTLTPTITATTISAVYFDFAKGGYLSYGV